MVTRGLLSVAAVLSVFGLFSGTAAAASAAGGPLYVALGDSITFGYNLSPGPQTVPSSLAYPFLAGKSLGDKTVDDGIPGLTTNGLLGLVQSGQYNQQLRQASLVTIDIGSNDLLHVAGSYLAGQRPLPAPVQKQLRAAIARFSPLFAKLLQAVRARTSGQIVLLDLYDPLPPGVPLFSASEQAIGAMNRILTREAAWFQLPVIDVYSLFNGSQLIDVRVLEQDVHPTAYGQTQIAKSLVQAVQSHGLAALVPVRYAVLSGRTVLYASSGLSGRRTTLAPGEVVRILSPGLPRTVSVQTMTGPPMRGFLPASRLKDVFTRYRQSVTFDAVHTQLTAGGYGITENGRSIALASPPITVRGQVYLPLASLARALGFRAVWQADARSVSLVPAPPTATTGVAPAAVRSATPTAHMVGTLRYEGIGLSIDGARVATPSLADEPFIWRYSVYVSLPVVDRMFHLYLHLHRPASQTAMDSARIAASSAAQVETAIPAISQ